MDRKTMKAGVLVGPGRVEIMDVPVPDMAPGMIRIRVSACGVCGSDIHMWKEGRKGVESQTSGAFHHGA